MQSSQTGRVGRVEVRARASLEEMSHHLQSLLFPLGLLSQSVTSSVDSEVERSLALAGGLAQLGQRGERAHQLQVAGETGAVEDGQPLAEDGLVDVQVVVVDQTDHQAGVGRMFASFLGLLTHIPLQQTEELGSISQLG